MPSLLTLACLFLTAGFSTCGKKKQEKSITPAPHKAELQLAYSSKLAEAGRRRSKDGWLGTSECDAMLFTGKYSCAVGASNGLTITAAEYPSEPGRFNRRPAPFCEAGAGSKTSWSRDMGMGLMAYAWCNKDLAVLQRHASYGEAHQWKMGEPLDDGRVVYTPSVIGHLYQLIYTLGGQDNANRVWPSIYSSGLTDFQAHLQMVDIWLRAEMAQRQIDLTGTAPQQEGHSNERNSLALAVSGQMFDRIKEHAEREPNCPFYQYMKGLYDTGELNTTVDLLLGDAWECSYYHESDRASDVHLAEWLFAASLTLKKL